MTYRRYRRKRSMVGEMIADTSYVANRLSWKGAAILGVILFVVFFWLVPAWINHQLNSLQSNLYRPLIEAAVVRRVHWVQWLGVALALICGFFAIRNFFSSQRLARNGERNVGFFSRLAARWLE